MRSTALLAFLACSVSALPQTRTPHGALHVENRAQAREGWVHIGPAQGHEVVRLTLGLKHQNTHLLDKIWWDVANPESPNYGKFLTKEELHERVAPHPDAEETVLLWLHKHGAKNIRTTNPPSFITADLSAASVEHALSTKLHHFLRENSIQSQAHPVLRASERFEIPDEIAAHVDMISGLSDWSKSKQQAKFERRRARRMAGRVAVEEGLEETLPPAIEFINNGNHEMEITVVPQCTPSYTCSNQTFFDQISSFHVELQSPNAQTTTIDIAITDINCNYEQDGSKLNVVDCLLEITGIDNWRVYNVSVQSNFVKGGLSSRAYSPALVVCGPWALPSLVQKLYNSSLPTTNTTTAQNSTDGVILFEFQYYSPDDLVAFLKANNLAGDAAAVVTPTDPNNPAQPGDEGQADIELISANGVGGKYGTYWYSGDAGDGVLLWAQQIANISDSDVPKVWSLSWGVSETQFDQFVGVGVQTRINHELSKMGIRGITLVVASGDAGVRDEGRSEFSCGVFEPSFPASSPYVLTVSATMLVQKNAHQKMSQNEREMQAGSVQEGEDVPPICNMSLSGKNISCDESGLEEAQEVAVACCSYGAVWTTGGGFSNNYTTPEWQSQAISNYFQRATFPPDSFWNRTGRGYPDVSVVGDKVPTILLNQVSNFGGTSASSPIMAGLVSLLNKVRLANNKPLLGPVTPLLYKIAASHPEAFNDITVGDNKCGELECCAEGFECSVGWDAVTGLGSPNVGLLARLVLEY